MRWGKRKKENNGSNQTSLLIFLLNWKVYIYGGCQGSKKNVRRKVTLNKLIPITRT